LRQYENLLRTIADQILKGDMAVGSKLPSERATAQKFVVSRSTVRRAWRELESLGYVTWSNQSTPVVIRPLESTVRAERSSVGRLAETLSPTFLGDLMQAAVSSARYNFEIGMPDPELLPVQDFQQILRELFSYPSREVFGYSPTLGLERVRRAISEEFLTRRSISMSYNNILVTAGSLQGLNLLTRLWVRPGDVILTESPTFAGALHIFRSHGAQILGIPIDSSGINVDMLESLTLRKNPRFLYIQPIGQNPTGVTLSPERRLKLLHWAQKSQIPIVEDDAYGFLSDEVNPPLAADNRQIPLVYLNTFSKILAPGIRVGFLAAPADLIRQLVALKQLSDLHTGTLSQLVAEGWLRQGRVDAHIQRARTIYKGRLKLATRIIKQATRLTPFAEPVHGFYLFAKLPSGLMAQSLHAKAVQRDILFAPGDPFSPDGVLFGNWIRLAIGAQPTAQIETGLRRLARLLDDETDGSSGSSQQTIKLPRS
jgi:2-aminoadipate transaminase